MVDLPAYKNFIGFLYKINSLIQNCFPKRTIFANTCTVTINQKLTPSMDGLQCLSTLLHHLGKRLLWLETHPVQKHICGTAQHRSSKVYELTSQKLDRLALICQYQLEFFVKHPAMIGVNRNVYMCTNIVHMCMYICMCIHVHVCTMYIIHVHVHMYNVCSMHMYACYIHCKYVSVHMYIIHTCMHVMYIVHM